MEEDRKRRKRQRWMRLERERYVRGGGLMEEEEEKEVDEVGKRKIGKGRRTDGGRGGRERGG